MSQQGDLQKLLIMCFDRFDLAPATREGYGVTGRINLRSGRVTHLDPRPLHFLFVQYCFLPMNIVFLQTFKSFFHGRNNIKYLPVMKGYLECTLLGITSFKIQQMSDFRRVLEPRSNGMLTNRGSCVSTKLEFHNRCLAKFHIGTIITTL